MRFYELLGSIEEPATTSISHGRHSPIMGTEAIVQPPPKKVTLKSINRLKLRQRARQAEVQQRHDFLPRMYGNRAEDELEIVRKTSAEQQKNREHIRKAAIRAIRTQRKREQETNDDAARYLKKRDEEQAQRIKALKRQFDKIRSE